MTAPNPRHTKQVRRYAESMIGITLGDIEFVMPLSEANDLVGMIYAARHTEAADAVEPANVVVPGRALIEFADRWALDGDYIRCRCCKRPQEISWMHHDFPHASDCRNAEAERRPWRTLSSLIAVASARAKVQDEPEPCGTCEGSGEVFVRRDSKGRVDYIDGSPTGETATCDVCRGEGVRS